MGSPNYPLWAVTVLRRQRSLAAVPKAAGSTGMSMVNFQEANKKDADVVLISSSLTNSNCCLASCFDTSVKSFESIFGPNTNRWFDLPLRCASLLPGSLRFELRVRNLVPWQLALCSSFHQKAPAVGTEMV